MKKHELIELVLLFSFMASCSNGDLLTRSAAKFIRQEEKQDINDSVLSSIPSDPIQSINTEATDHPDLEDKDGLEKQQPTRPIVPPTTPKPKQSNIPKDQHISCHEILNSQNQCQFAQDHCQDYKIGFVNYVNLYYCQPSSSAQRWVSLILYILILIILFTSLGITASEFLCPNLDTLAKLFKMSESLAGVTLLALGNGSPDVFSTLEAMKIDSPSLAIGELVGAAMFITCVVVGCMAIIKPFKVNKKPFMRDTAFLLISIVITIIFLSDQDLNIVEAFVMMALYISYVVFVVFWDWITMRRQKASMIEQKMRNVQGFENGTNSKLNLSRYPSNSSTSNGHTDDVEGAYIDAPMGFVDEEHDLGTFDQFQEELEDETIENFQEWKKSSSSSAVLIRPSLLSALDLNHKYLTSPNTELSNPIDQIPLNLLPRIDTSPGISRTPILSPADSFLKMSSIRRFRDNDDHEEEEEIQAEDRTSFDPLEVVNKKLMNNVPPAILITDENDQTEEDQDINNIGIENSTIEEGHIQPTVQVRSSRSGSHSSQHSNISFERELQNSHNNLNEFIHNILQTKILDDSSGLFLFFPTLLDISEKSIIDILVTIICLPTTTLLQFTVPVVNTDPTTKSIDDDLLLHRGYFFLLTRCVIAPFAAAFLIGYKNETEFSMLLMVLVPLTVSLGLCYFVKYTAEVRRTTSGRRLMKYFHFVIASIGFLTAITWISTIATELISIIKFFSILFDLSDAILGVTVFAVGNSLADFISNFTIAKMGFPMMALSACFGGPLLNIMLGIGCSSLYIIPQKGWEDIRIDFSATLIVSFVTVLINLIFLLVIVPLNGWWMNRIVGVTMISFWAVATVICVIIEILQ